MSAEVARRPDVSVIVPIRNEAPEVVERFAALARDPACELIVADAGGSREAPERFAGIGARVLRGDGTRGRLLALAAGEARGDILLFFHADSRPPADALAAIRSALSSGSAAGAFSLAYENATAGLRWVAWWANIRSRLLGLPFGDQGLFCRRADYFRAGGFRDLPICDDLDLVRRLKRLGPIVIRPEACVTSPRRYLAAGTLRQLLRNWRVQVGFYAGVEPDRLARWYEGRRRQDSGRGPGEGGSREPALASTTPTSSRRRSE